MRPVPATRPRTAGSPPRSGQQRRRCPCRLAPEESGSPPGRRLCPCRCRHRPIVRDHGAASVNTTRRSQGPPANSEQNADRERSAEEHSHGCYGCTGEEGSVSSRSTSSARAQHQPRRRSIQKSTLDADQDRSTNKPGRRPSGHRRPTPGAPLLTVGTGVAVRALRTASTLEYNAMTRILATRPRSVRHPSPPAASRCARPRSGRRRNPILRGPWRGARPARRSAGRGRPEQVQHHHSHAPGAAG